MFSKLSPFLAAVLAAVAAALGVRLLPPTAPPVAPPPATAPQPADPPKPAEPKPATDPRDGIAQILIGNSGCSASVIDPKRGDGRYWLLTAAHCLSAVGERGAGRLRDGREFAFAVQSFDRQADCAWLLTEPTTDVYPWLVLADASPEVGAKVYHAGFGVHIPGNTEYGQVVAKPNADGQVQYHLSVSSGDSGGGIALNDSGQVISPVCCTTAKGQYANVWGASPERCRALRPKTSVKDLWTPLDIPLKAVPMKMPEK